MSTFVFPAEQVRELYEHAKAASRHSATFEHLLDPSVLKDGETMPEGGILRQDQIDNAKVPAHLVLAKDTGVYLMSSGLPLLAAKGDERGPNRTPYRPLNHVVFADGHGPQDGYGDMGGDDFAEAIPLSFFREAIERGAAEISVQITEEHVRVSFSGTLEQERPKVDPSWLAYIEKQIPPVKKTVWAETRGTYRGAIVGVDEHAVAQYVETPGLLVLHEKADMGRAVRLGEILRIRYPKRNQCVIEHYSAKTRWPEA